MEPTDVPVIVLIASSLASGLAGALASTWAHLRREKRRFRMDTLKKFAANRHNVLDPEFTRALNETFVVFNDDQFVMQRLEEFHKEVVARSSGVDDAILRLYKAMCAATGVRYDIVNDSFFMKPFAANAPVKAVTK